MRICDKNTFFNKRKTINCKGKIIDLSVPVVMGVLNITPDSFYDGGRYTTEKEILEKTHLMLEEGATIIDIGAVSTRPGAEIISEEEELQRLKPVMQSVIREFPCAIFSVDTFRANIAKFAINEGASIINDIFAGRYDKNMFETIARLQVPYIMMHIKGEPKNMQINPQYDDVINEIIQFFSERLDKLRSLGVHDIIIDPGFGFGKSIEHNYEILRRLEEFNIFELPILVGLSRKSMIYKILEITPDEALNGTTVVNTIALLQGVDIMRVHDVKQAIEAIKIIQKLRCYTKQTQVLAPPFDPPLAGEI